MWQLINHSHNVTVALRNFVLRQPLNSSICLTRNNLFTSLRAQCIRGFVKQAPQPKDCLIKLTPLTRITFGVGTCAFVHITFNRAVLCEAKRTRLVGFKRINDSELEFDWHKLWSYILPQIWYLIAATVGALFVAILNIQIPLAMSGIINVVTEYMRNNDSSLFFDQIKQPAIQLVSMYVLQSAFTFMYIYLLSGIGERIAHNMKTDLFTSILKQDVSFFDEQRTGELVNRLTSDVQDFKSSFKQCISGGLRNGTQILGCGASLFMISPQMTVVTLLCIPSVVAIGSLFGILLRALSRTAQAQAEKTTAVAEEAISNIRTVRAFGMEDQEYKLYSSESERSQNLNIMLGFGIGLFQAGSNLFLNGMVLSTIYMGGHLLSTNELTAGQLMAFLMATQTIQKSLGQLSLLFGSVVKGLAAGSRVFEYINMQPKTSLKTGNIIPFHSLVGDVSFENVSFSYPARPEKTVLKNFTLRIPAGKTVALVGASGNGKSTVACLLERFYDADSGSIKLDGHDLRTLNPTWLRQRVLGLISQEPVLFATTIRENIRYGKPEASDSEVENAARLANADGFITSFPRGYDTVVGERGATLSGGQKQRVAIARALLKDPSVLILDEATSALDAESEKVVQAALDKARSGRTVLVIAHRMSTVRNADIIVVISGGEIVEEGNHESLTKLKGYYWSLIQQQTETKKPTVKST